MHFRVSLLNGEPQAEDKRVGQKATHKFRYGKRRLTVAEMVSTAAAGYSADLSSVSVGQDREQEIDLIGGLTDTCETRG